MTDPQVDAVSDKRVRTLTPKGVELYEQTRDAQLAKYVPLRDVFDDVLEKSTSVSTHREALAIQQELTIAFKKYQEASSSLKDFFVRCNHDASASDLHHHAEMINLRESKYKETIEALSMYADVASSTSMSRSSSLATRKRAEAEASKAKAVFARKKLELIKQQTLLQEQKKINDAQAERQNSIMKAELDALDNEEEAAVADAEAAVFEAEEGLNPGLNMPKVDILSNTADFILKHQEPVKAVPALNPNSKVFVPVTKVEGKELRQEDHPLTENAVSGELLSTIFLRKDLLISRLVRFNERPENFEAWKASFRSVLEELKASPQEEFDLLIKYLGPESARYALSLRASNAANPARGLKLLWERLEDRFGCPEMLESCLKAKIDSFPSLSGKDNRRLYELCDILDEIQSAKENPKLSAFFSVYDSSAGVNTIIRKLPHHLRQKWINQASKYKQEHQVSFPPFSFLVDFVRQVCKMSNDPAFQFEVVKKDQTQAVGQKVLSRKSDVLLQEKNDRCPIHKADHKLTMCKTFIAKTWEEKRNFLREKNLCYKCLRPNHIAKNCRQKPECSKCKKGHLSVMHNDQRRVVESRNDGGERINNNFVSSKCTSVCKDGSRSCGKILLTRVYADNPDRSILVYAILDDQSNRSLATTELLDELGVKSEECAFTLSSCSGTKMISGRKVDGLHIESFDGSTTLELPTVLECSVPEDISEIPTPEVAHRHVHLNAVASLIPPFNVDARISLLIGRDLPQAHHVLEQVIGPPSAPFAQRLPLGWAIVGEICLDGMHKPSVVHVSKTNILSHGRESIFDPCQNIIGVKEEDNIGLKIFEKTKDDEKRGLSIEDKKFLTLMDTSFAMNEKGRWTAPLPFKDPAPTVFNNKSEAKRRAHALHKSLIKNPRKREHFFVFMKKVLDSGAAERAPALDDEEDCWYLPLFGVYHPQKPDKIRGVFDSSATYHGVSLNSLLLSGPDLTNSLIGILLRFRKDSYAITADIEQMFYQFFVQEDHRNFLRFFWYRDNNFDNPLVEFRMTVHVFGNSPSPAVATYGLRKAVTDSDQDVKTYVEDNFYVDDGVASLPSREDAVSLMQRTKADLMQNGKIKLHKIASSDKEILKAFPKEHLSEDLQSLDFSDASSILPVHKCLGLDWNLNTDCFCIVPQLSDTPFTRRGLLSTLNGIFDPLGFLAPSVVTGKILLREIAPDGRNWDDDLPHSRENDWQNWKRSHESLQGLEIPRKCVPLSLSETLDADLHIFCDASEKAIAAVVYVKVLDDIGFVMGKTKLAPISGHTVPRLELCSAVLAAELYEFILSQLHMDAKSVTFYTDSRVVLGYICNETRRFHTYVSNRIERIRRVSNPEQWKYVPTNLNPADVATRVDLVDLKDKVKRWLQGPQKFLNEDAALTSQGHPFPLVCPDTDKEVRLSVLKTEVTTVDNQLVTRFDHFSSWTSMINGLSLLRHICKSFHSPSNSCKGWHCCSQHQSVNDLKSTETFVVRSVQQEVFSEERRCLQQGRSVHKSSPLFSLSPYLDEDGLLKVGGRLRHAEEIVGHASVHPIILPKKHHVSILLVRHFHEKVKHQGRHFTEGALRMGGYWIVGAKRLVSSEIQKCLPCKRLRGVAAHQQMASLPPDRVIPSAPFSHVGVDVFGPWSVVTRKTRGGLANSKRWAVVFTCLAIRAVHIEVIEEMSSSSFINALTRFTSLRGPVSEFRSDRGSNFVGAVKELGLKALSVEDGPVSSYLARNRISWKFNPPYASHMGGVWERMIGVIRRILDSMLLDMRRKPLTHEVLCTLMAEVCAVVNGRPIVPVSHDPDSPFLLTPSVLLTQKVGSNEVLPSMDLKDMYKSQWKHVQVLSDIFWKHWKQEFLQSLQKRRKWQAPQENVKEGDLVILRDRQHHRNDWPVGIITKTFSNSDDDLVRSAEIRVIRDGSPANYVRPITELVLL